MRGSVALVFIVIRPVPEVPDGSLALASFYLLDDPVWNPYGELGDTERYSDGLHVKVPSFAGRAVLTVWNTDYDYYAGEVSCPGFGFCFAE